MLTDLTASITGGVLTVTGAAAQPTAGGDPIYLYHNSNATTLTDNNDVAVTIIGDQASIRTIDMSGVTGAGVYISAGSNSSLSPRSFTGSQQSDVINSANGNDKLIGLNGNDGLGGGGGNDKLYGGNGSDSLYGGSGDDFLYGGNGKSGADYFNGDSGNDTIVFSGARSEYQIDIVNGEYRVTHIGGTGADGTDRYINVEFLQFKDQTVSTDSVLTDLTASITGGVLTVTGAAAQPTAGGDPIYLYHNSSATTLTDNNDVAVTIIGDQASIRTIDMSGVTGAGVYISAGSNSSLSPRSFTGSQQSDVINSANGNDKLIGLNGNDGLGGGGGNDKLYGGNGSDSLYGGSGDDFLYGGNGKSGADYFNGDSGNDTIVFSGARSEYQIDIVNGEYRVTHIGGTGADGTDRYINVEFLQFKDEVLSAEEWSL